MRVSKTVFVGFVGLLVGFRALLDYLRRIDPSRVNMHLVGSAVVIVLLPFMKQRFVRYFQVFTLCWLFGDIVFQRIFETSITTHTDVGSWRGVLAVAYAIILVMLAKYDRLFRTGAHTGVDRNQMA